MTTEADRPIVWTVAGSDSGGGAGIQADLKTMNALETHGCSVLTAITAQNTRGVRMAEAVSMAMLHAQLQALQEDLPPTAAKTGMLMNAAIVEVVAAHFRQHATYLVCDPVCVASSGDALLDRDGMDALRSLLLPLADLVTPNLAEAEALTGLTVRTPAEMKGAARALLSLGARSVLVKGGHGTAVTCRDYWTDGHSALWYSSPRRPSVHTHGTGCTLSAAITAALARGYTPVAAIHVGKAYINQGIRTAPGLGSGHGPLRHGPFPDDPQDQPEISEDTP